MEITKNNSVEPSLNHILNPQPHGFRPGKSTISCSVSFPSFHIFDYFNKSEQVDVILIDFSKAFEIVNHNLLNKELDLNRNGHHLLFWFRTSLTERKQLN